MQCAVDKFMFLQCVEDQMKKCSVLATKPRLLDVLGTKIP